MKAKKWNYSTIILITVLSILSGFLIYLNFFELRDNIDSDIVAEMNYGQLVWKQMSIFPDGWYYANELSFFRPAIIMSFIYGISSNFILSQSISVLFAVIIWCIALVYMLKGCKISMNGILLSIILLMGGFTYEFTRLFTVFYAYYAFYLATIFFTIGYMLRLYNNEIKHPIVYNSIAALSAICLGLIGIRMTFFLYLPLIIIVIIQIIQTDGSIRKEKFWYIIYSIELLVINLCGVAFNLVTFGNSGRMNIAINFNFIATNNITDKFNKCIYGILKQCGITGDIPIISISGVSNILKIGLIALFIVFCIFLYKKLSNDVKYVVLFFLVSILCITIILMMTDFADPSQTYFYFFMVPILVIIILVSIIDSVIKDRLINIIVISYIFLCVLINCYVTYTPMIKNNRNAALEKVAIWIEGNTDDSNVYATFWNSGVIKAVSNGEVEVDTITFITAETSSNITLMNWLRDENLILSSEFDRETIIVVNEEEEKALIENPKSIINIYQNSKVYDDEKYKVYKFSYNPFGYFSMPDKVDETKKIRPYGYSMSFNESASIDEELNLISSADTECIFMYGPYYEVKDGKYDIKIEYEILEHTSNQLGYVELFESAGSNQNENIIMSIPFDLENEYLEFKAVEFNPELFLEIRAFNYLRTSIKIKNIYITRIK